MGKQEGYLQSIHRLYPDFRTASFDVEFNDGGQNSDVLIVNGEWVFRFPRYLHVLEWLKTETAILLGIQGYVPLDVPTPMFMNLEDRAVGDAFIGYRMIPGEPLWRGTLRAIWDEETLREKSRHCDRFECRSAKGYGARTRHSCRTQLFDL